MPENTEDTRLVTILLIIGAFVIFPMFFMGFGMMGFGPMMGGMWGGGMWSDGTIPGWMFIVGILMQLLFLAALVGGGYLIYRVVTGSESGSDQALEELRLAYARGELTDDEYEQRREALQRDTESRQD
ncbi:putative membrane protein [Natronoarchaeum philippinense]|uniref:Putative membrane protein n=1 Tax=Natronoarchaeum philippinense TaxID=558529 RepID=A0A285N2K7_NATPI|nr:SHOCT domain-containing protein [Natronoarchaeum philippinense]SNZ03705.1 putative membrane protein [Natronoarchaeum philippinense]